MLEPVLLGGGKRLFPDDAWKRPLQLVSVVPAATGVLVCTYRPRSGRQASCNPRPAYAKRSPSCPV